MCQLKIGGSLLNIGKVLCIAIIQNSLTVTLSVLSSTTKGLEALRFIILYTPTKAPLTRYMGYKKSLEI